MTKAMIIWALLIAALWVGFYITYDYSNLANLAILLVSGIAVTIAYYRTMRKTWCVFMAITAYAAIAGSPLFGSLAIGSSIFGYLFIKEARGYFLAWWKDGFEGIWTAAINSLLYEEKILVKGKGVQNG